MIEPDIHSVNHVGIAVRDITATSKRYEEFGFKLTPFSDHVGAWKPGAPITKLGSGNRCVMFAQNYLEILANSDPEKPSERLAGFLGHHQGGHIICFGSEDLFSVEKRLVANGLGTSGVLPLQRDVDTPDGSHTAKFERIQFAPNETPEGYIQAARHLTPEYVYQPRYIDHPNGCTELSNTVLVVDDINRFVERYAVYTGTPAQRDDSSATFHFQRCSRLTIMTQAAALKALPGTLYPPIPGIAAMGFRCPDIAAQARRLRENRVPFNEVDQTLVVPAEEACGIALIFE